MAILCLLHWHDLEMRDPSSRNHCYSSERSIACKVKPNRSWNSVRMRPHIHFLLENKYKEIQGINRQLKRDYLSAPGVEGELNKTPVCSFLVKREGSSVRSGGFLSSGEKSERQKGNLYSCLDVSIHSSVRAEQAVCGIRMQGRQPQPQPERQLFVESLSEG